MTLPKYTACMALFQLFQCFNVVGPRVVELDVGDVLAGEAAPVALAQQRRFHNLLAVGCGQDAAGVDAALQVAGHESIDVPVFHLIGQPPGLFNAHLREFALRLSLHDLPHVVNGFAMPNKV